jgi:hypothetical protein
MFYYTYIDDCHQDIIYSLNEKIDRTKINDDDYITTFINNNLINEINTTIYKKLLSFTSDKNQKFIENCKNYYYGYNIFGCIHLYKKYYKDDEEFNELLMDTEDLLYNDTNEKELKFFAKLALVIIYDDIINNETKINDLKDEIKDYIINYDDE